MVREAGCGASRAQGGVQGGQRDGTRGGIHSDGYQDAEDKSLVPSQTAHGKRVAPSVI